MSDDQDLTYQLRKTLMDAKIRGVSRKDRSYIRCELLLELVMVGGIVYSSMEEAGLMGVDVLAEMSALNQVPGRASHSYRRDIILAIEEYAKYSKHAG